MSTNQSQEAPIVRALFIAALTALAIVVLADEAARLILKRVHVPNSYSDMRNEGIDRGWPQYTAPQPRQPNERLIIIISNSQGIGRELANPSRIYAAKLETLLKRHDPKHAYRVANWSMNGGASPEFVVLAARAVAHRPDAVFVITYRENVLDKRVFNPLSFARNNVQYLAYMPEVRRYLSPWYLKHFQVHSRRGWLAAYSHLVQLHNLYMVPPSGVAIGQVDYPQSLRRADRPWHDVGDTMLVEIYETLRRGARDTHLFIVSMPVQPELFTATSREPLRSFASRARRQLDGRPGVTVLDAVDVVDPSLFYTATHFRPEGHTRFAQWLFEQLKGFWGMPEPAAQEAPR